MSLLKSRDAKRYVSELRDGDPLIRRQAVLGLLRIQKAAVKPLIDEFEPEVPSMSAR